MTSFKGQLNPRYKHGNRVLGVERICLNCGESFLGFATQKFCSRSCVSCGSFNPQWKGGLVEVRCEICGKWLKRRLSVLKRFKHHVCPECKPNIQAHFYAGENSPNWKGGAVGYYGRDEWKKTREYLLDFHGRKCFRCGKTDNLMVHHITPWRKRSENLYTFHFLVLCRSCHPKLEGKSIEEQMNSWEECRAET